MKNQSAIAQKGTLQRQIQQPICVLRKALLKLRRYHNCDTLGGLDGFKPLDALAVIPIKALHHGIPCPAPFPQAARFDANGHIRRRRKYFRPKKRTEAFRKTQGKSRRNTKAQTRKAQVIVK